MNDQIKDLRRLNKDNMYRSDVENLFLMEMMLQDRTDILTENSDIDNFLPETTMGLFESINGSPEEEMFNTVTEYESVLY